MKISYILILLFCLILSSCSEGKSGDRDGERSESSSKSDVKKSDEKIIMLDMLFHPSQSYIALVGSDGNLRIWDFKQKKITKTLPGDTSYFRRKRKFSRYVSFNFDGSLLVCVNGKGVDIRSTRNWEKLSHIEHHGHPIFHPKSNHLATVHEDGRKATFWNLENPRKPSRKKSFNSFQEIRSIAFHPYGDQLVCGGNGLGGHNSGLLIKVFFLKTGEVVAYHINGDDKFLRSLSFSGDGEFLAGLGDHYGGSLKIWSMTDGATYDGDATFNGTWERFHGRKIRQGHHIKRYKNAKVIYLIVDGAWFYKGGFRGDKRKFARTFRADLAPTIDLLNKGILGKMYGKYLRIREKDQVRITPLSKNLWKMIVKNRQMRMIIQKRKDSLGGTLVAIRTDVGPIMYKMHEVEYSPDSEMVAGVNREKVQIWIPYKWRIYREIKIKNVSCIAFSPDSSLLAIANEQGLVIYTIDKNLKSKIWKFKSNR